MLYFLCEGVPSDLLDNKLDTRAFYENKQVKRVSKNYYVYIKKKKNSIELTNFNRI